MEYFILEQPDYQVSFEEERYTCSSIAVVTYLSNVHMHRSFGTKNDA